MKILLVLLFLLPAFNICRAELTLPKLERPAPAMQPASNEQKEQEAKPATKEDPNKMLHEAADKMHLRGIYNALLAGADVNSIYEGMLPLERAIFANSPGTVKYLIKCGADVNKRGEHNWPWPPILIAVQEQSIEIIDILLENGADIQTKLKNTGKFTITSEGNTLYKFPYDQDALTEAQNLNIIKHFIAKGYKINGKNLSPALYRAAIVNDMASIKYIVGKGLKYKDFNMTPALVITIEEGWFDAMKYLRANGAAIPNFELTTPNKEIYDYLKLHKANITFKPNKKPMEFIETPKKKPAEKAPPAKKPETNKKPSANKL